MDARRDGLRGKILSGARCHQSAQRRAKAAHSSADWRGGEQVTLKLVAQYGDACNVSGSLETIEHKFDVLKKHCEAVGRDYERIRHTVTLCCMIGETDEQAEAKVPAVLRSRAGMTSALIGSPATLHKRLIELEEADVQEIILRFSDVLNLDMLRFFAKEFIV